MPLSIDKLEQMLASKGFIAQNYYTLDEYCIYLQVFSIQNADSFMLYVSGRYELVVKDRPNIYKLLYMEITDQDNIVANYGGEPDKADTEEVYTELNLDNAIQQSDNLEQKLKENYNREITLKDLSLDDRKNIRDIFRQLGRFMFCVKNVKYKLSIFYRNYLCSITKDDELDVFLIHDYPSTNDYRLYIYIDLKSFYSNIKTDISADIKTIKDGIQKLLNQNQIKHSKILNDILEKRVEVLKYSEIVHAKKQEYIDAIQQLEMLLKTVVDSENEILSKINEIKNTNTDYGLSGLHSDIERSHIMRKHESDLEQINSVKQEIIKNILAAKVKYDNILLQMDKIVFDQTIMLNEISKNFSKLMDII